MSRRSQLGGGIPLGHGLGAAAAFQLQLTCGATTACKSGAGGAARGRQDLLPRRRVACSRSCVERSAATFWAPRRSRPIYRCWHGQFSSALAPSLSAAGAAARRRETLREIHSAVLFMVSTSIAGYGPHRAAHRAGVTNGAHGIFGGGAVAFRAANTARCSARLCCNRPGAHATAAGGPAAKSCANHQSPGPASGCRPG